MGQPSSDKWGTEIAKMFKDLEVGSKIGVITGRVVGISPLVISIMSGDVLINSRIQSVYITETLSKKRILIGDIVLVIPDETEKVFYIIDKIKRN